MTANRPWKTVWHGLPARLFAGWKPVPHDRFLSITKLLAAGPRGPAGGATSGHTMGKGGTLVKADPGDAELLARFGLTSAKRVMRYRPASIAAVSGSSETFPIDLNETQRITNAIEGEDSHRAESVAHVGSRDAAARIDAPSGKAHRVYVKRYRYKGWGVRLKGMFRGTLLGKSRARFEYDFLREMRRRAVPAVRPIAFGEQRRLGFLKACFLITQDQAGFAPLDGSAMDPSGNPFTDARFVASLASQIRRMHRAGVVHGGLFARNILVQAASTKARAGDAPAGNAPEDRGDDDAWQFCFLDPNPRGGFHATPAPDEGRLADLSDLAATAAAFIRATDVPRFLRAYFQVRKIDEHVKTVFHSIRKLAQAKRSRERHRLAVGDALAWLDARIRRPDAQGEAARPRFQSLPAFLDHLRRCAPADAQTGSGAARVALVFQSTGDDNPSTRYTLVVDEKALTIREGGAEAADLTITSDAEAWLAVVNGDPAAVEHVRGGRVRIDGDTSSLPLLGRWIGK